MATNAPPVGGAFNYRAQEQVQHRYNNRVALHGVTGEQLAGALAQFLSAKITSVSDLTADYGNAGKKHPVGTGFSAVIQMFDAQGHIYSQELRNIFDANQGPLIQAAIVSGALMPKIGTPVTDCSVRVRAITSRR